MDRSPDLLLIMGTSLKVHGIKQMVKMFVKAIVDSHKDLLEKEKTKGVKQNGAARTVKGVTEMKVKDSFKVIFVNKTKPDKEWDNVVDIWIEGDCETFTQGIEAIWQKVRPEEWLMQETLEAVVSKRKATTCKSDFDALLWICY